MPDINVTESGGIAVVILAKDFDMPKEFDGHPQIHPLFAVDLPTDTKGLAEKIPDTTKVIIVGGELPGQAFKVLKTYLDRKMLPYIQRRNPTALQDTMRRCLPPRKTTDPTAAEREARAFGAPVGDIMDAKTNGNGVVLKDAQKPMAERGAIKALVKAETNWAKSNMEEARRLMHIAQARGITTTLGSLAQAISMQRREGNKTAVPKSILSEDRKMLMVLDEAIMYGQEMIEKLKDVRNYVETSEEKVQKALQTVRKFKELSASLTE